MDPESALEKCAAEQGWTLETQVVVLLEYIKNQQSDEAFADFLAEKVTLEKAEDEDAVCPRCLGDLCPDGFHMSGAECNGSDLA